MTLNRRMLLAHGGALAAIGALGARPAFAADGDTHNVADLMAPGIESYKDWPIGNPEAKVTVIEYMSSTCPHCARFANDVFPAFREQYVDTNKVQFIARPFNRNALDFAVFMLAATATDADGYLKVVDTYFKTQDDWAFSEKPKDAIFAVAQTLGFTQESFESALTNQALYTGMEQLRQQALDKFDLTGTPTFYINGKQISGEKTLEEMAAEIDPLL